MTTRYETDAFKPWASVFRTERYGWSVMFQIEEGGIEAVDWKPMHDATTEQQAVADASTELGIPAGEIEVQSYVFS